MTDRNFEEAGKLMEWVETEVFSSLKYDDESLLKVAGIATKELGMLVPVQELKKSMFGIRQRKNFNIAKYPFTV